MNVAAGVNFKHAVSFGINFVFCGITQFCLAGEWFLANFHDDSKLVYMRYPSKSISAMVCAGVTRAIIAFLQLLTVYGDIKIC